MIGIILWSDLSDQKAVIWCEDQGDLAYLPGCENVTAPDPFFDVGDVVEFDIQTQRNMRLALNPSRVAQQTAGTSLTDSLRSVPMTQDHVVSNTAKVIPFRPDHATSVGPAKTGRRKLLG